MVAKHVLLIALFFFSLCAGCSPQPAGDWTVSSPEAQGMDPQVLESMFQTLEEYPRSQIQSVLIVRNGVIVAERYYQGYDQNRRNTLYSCTKSVISALVGIAIEEGLLKGVDQPVSDFFSDALAENPDPRKSALLLEDLLTMRAGLEWQEGNPAYRSLYLSRDWVAFMLKKPLAAGPGTVFNYCSGCTHVLSGVLSKAAGMPTQAYARARLFEPLGIQNYAWEEDAAGNAIGGWGLDLTARDMAKFGSLFLNGGSWDGKQIVPASWVEQSTRAEVVTGNEWDYGYQWWVKPAENLYAAQGMHGQKIYVIPDRQMVVVVTAGADDGSVVGNLVLNAAMSAVK